MNALNTEKQARTPPPVALPKNIAVYLAKFILDKRTGNVVLNIKEGKILAAHLTDMVRAED